MTIASDRFRVVLLASVLALTGCRGGSSTSEPDQLRVFGHVYHRGTIELPSLQQATRRFGDLPVVSRGGSVERGSGTPLPTAVLLHASSGYRNYDLSGAP